MQINPQSPFKTLQRNPTPSVRSKTISSKRGCESNNEELTNNKNLEQMFKIQVELRYAEEKQAQLEEKMINQMKRIGDGQISHMYKRMMKQERELRKEIRELKIKKQLLIKQKEIKLKASTKIGSEDKKSRVSQDYKSIDEAKDSRMKSDHKFQFPKEDIEGKSVHSRKKSISSVSDFKSQKSQQLVKYEGINNEEQSPKGYGFNKSKISRKDTIESLKAQLIKSQILIGEGIELIKKNSDPVPYPISYPVIEYPYVIYPSYNARPVFGQMFHSRKWI